MQRFNWRKLFFYAAELVFAIISGNAESSIYQAYLPPGSISQGESNARAIITQVAIVLFSVAFVEAAQMRGKGRFAALAFIGLLNAAFSLQAFWFIREAALINEHAAYLQPAWDHPLNLFGALLSGSDVDPFMVASMPFFQVALSWVGPLIVREKNEETPEQQTARQQRELNEMKYKQEKRIIQAKGIRATFKAATQEETPEDISEQDPNKDETNSAGDAVETLDKPITKPTGMPRGMIGKDGLQAWAKREHGRELTDDEANGLLKDAKGSTRWEAAQGRPYIASAASAKALAKKRYPLQVIRLVDERKRA